MFRKLLLFVFATCALLVTSCASISKDERSADPVASTREDAFDTAEGPAGGESPSVRSDHALRSAEADRAESESPVASRNPRGTPTGAEPAGAGPVDGNPSRDSDPAVRPPSGNVPNAQSVPRADGTPRPRTAATPDHQDVSRPGGGDMLAAAAQLELRERRGGDVSDQGTATAAHDAEAASGIPTASVAGGRVDDEGGRFAGATVLDLAAKTGQLLMVQFRREADGTPIRRVTPEVRRVMETVRPGGVILFAENIATVDQTVDFISDLQEASDIPLFISVDEEGGFVSRLNRSARMSATPVPSAAMIGSTKDPEYARLAGHIIGTELRSLGINMNMAPVADVNTNPANGIIARHERSFGTEPVLVAEMVSAMVEGLQSAGVSAVLKHFPGHGDTDEDTHTGIVISDSDLNRLRDVELGPFRRGIETGADGIMTAHIAYPLITGDHTPATFSDVLLKDLLRDEMGFAGLVISDALEMGAVAKTDLGMHPVVAAVAAGVDLVLTPRDAITAHDELVRAVSEGILSEDRLNDAVESILRAKARRGLFEPAAEVSDPAVVLGNSEHRRIVEDLLESARRNSHTRGKP